MATVRRLVAPGRMRCQRNEADFKPCPLALGDRSHEWVLEADITACFDESEHAAPLARLRRRVREKCILNQTTAVLLIAPVDALRIEELAAFGSGATRRVAARRGPPRLRCQPPPQEAQGLAAAPNRVWPTDRPYARTWAEFVYGVFVFDVCARFIVSRQAASTCAPLLPAMPSRWRSGDARERCLLPRPP